MHHLKYLLIILASSFLLMSYGDENEDTPSELECMKGLYTGRADFERMYIGLRAYNLEVNYNSNEMIFLLTSLSLGLGNGSQVCTIYQNPRFSISEEDETLFNIESDLIEIRGEFIDTRGIFSITTSTTQEQACNGISEFKLYRQGDDHGSLTWFGSPIAQPSRVIGAELRSFDELRSDCDALEITEFFHNDLKKRK